MLTTAAEVWSDMCAKLMADMFFRNNSAISAVGAFHFPLPHSLDKYIRCWLLRFGAGQFAILPAGSKLTVMAGRTDRETSYTGFDVV